MVFCDDIRPGPVRLFLGGRLALDFVNTMDNRIRPATREDLPDYVSLAAWAWQVGVVDEMELERLKQMAAHSPADAVSAYEAAIGLREALFRIFRSIARSEPAAEPDIRELDRVAAAARSLQQLAKGAGNYRWVWKDEAFGLDRPAASVALAAADLLTCDDLSRLKECPGPDGCGWLFFDETKNRSRRWCSMEYCGAAAKARRFAERHGTRKAGDRHETT